MIATFTSPMTGATLLGFGLNPLAGGFQSLPSVGFSSGVPEKVSNKMKKQLLRVGSLVGFSVFAGAASAAVDPAITTAITTMQADAVTVASAVLVAIISVVAIKFIRKGM